ncbi:MAG TPA: carboxypeptidase-like regulatory domain-containing protein, partial [Candidatus Angelobacter sp.]
MASVHRTILIALALAAPLAAQTTPEDPPPAIVEGSVINIQNSRTIPRATVTLLHLKGTGSKSQRADGSGHFMFKNVEPGIYRLMAERQGFFSDDRKREYQPQFEVAVGAHVKNLPVRLMPAAVVSGEVLDEYSDPVQDAEIRLLGVQMRLGQMDLRVAGKAMTNDRGEYRIAGLHPGKYYIVLEYKSKALATLTSIVESVNALQNTTDDRGKPVKVEMPAIPDPAYTYPSQFYPSTSDFMQAQSLRLSPGDEIAVNFLLISAPVVSIRGRVTNGITGGPPAGAQVSAFWTPYMGGDGIPGQVFKQNGAFEIRGLAPGTYTLRTSFTEDKLAFEGEQTVEVGNQGAENVQIAALPDFAAAGHVTIAGDLKNPIARVMLAFAGEGTMPRVQASASFPEFKFDAQLRPERRYHAAIRNLPEDYYLKSLAISGHDMPPDNVVVSGMRGDIEIVLSPAGARIEGILFDTGGEPTRGSILLIPDVPDPGPPDLFRRASTDSKGKFTLHGVAPGSYRMLAAESVNLSSEINDPDFQRTIGNRGQSLIVEENG